MSILKKSLLSLVIAALPALSADNNFSYDQLPSIGTIATSTLSIDKEIAYGDAYMRTLRASEPVVNDPVLNNYINILGATLLRSAQDVKTPFEFFLVQKNEINAFAFFGGHIGLNTGLFYHAQSESELASVIAHEIAHLTQRHLARAMEDQARKSALTTAALIGSALLAVAAPQAGIAAFQTTTAASLQDKINYTRSNEQEADRIGMQTLAKARFDPQAMPSFFMRMADQYRFASKPPQLLLTHPLPDSRITESRNLAKQHSPRSLAPSRPFLLAQARIVARHLNLTSAQALDWFDRKAKKAPAVVVNATNYGKALIYIDRNQPQQAQALLQPLLSQEPTNLFYIDAMTDLEISQKRYASAIMRLDQALQMQPNDPVLQVNRLYTLIKSGDYAQAQRGLLRYTYDFPNDLIGWDLLQEAYEKQGIEHGALAAQAEQLALRAQWDRAIKNYVKAANLLKTGSLDQARYEARIDQLQAERVRFNALTR
ncbi:MAG: M48 family metalloprotease [Enterovibrio sp.]